MKEITILLNDIYKCGGVQRVVSVLSNRLVQTGKYRITLLSLFRSGPSPYFKLDSRIAVTNIFTEPFSLQKHLFKAVRAVKQFEKRNPTDIFIGAGVGLCVLLYGAFWHKQSIRMIGWEHHHFFVGKKFGLEWIGRRIACKKMDAIVVLTQKDLRYYRENIKNIIRIEQIYNPFNADKTTTHYDADAKKIMSCGSLVSEKGYEYAVEVAKIVFEKHPDWQWHVFGDGSKRESIASKIKEYRLQDKLILKGYCSPIEEQFGAYSLFVLTSKTEGFGLVLLEAQASGLPVVCFDCNCGPSEIIQNGVNGCLIECFDVTQMAASICELIENRQRRVAFSNDTFVDKEKFMLEQVVSKWESLLDTLSDQ